MDQNQVKTGWRPGKLGIGMGVADGGLEYFSRRKNNPEESVAKSATIAAGVAAGWTFAAPVMWAKMIYDGAHGAGQMMDGLKRASWETQFQQNDMRGMIGGNFQDTDFAYTSRQRGVQAIQQSRMNARSALSNEARSLHRL